MALTTVFIESGMVGSQKLSGLNELETQAGTGQTYIDAYLHDGIYYVQAYMDSTYYRTPSHPRGRNDGSGSGLNAATLHGYTLQAVEAQGLPSGIIALWAKDINNIALPWVFMNGSNGTIDTRGRLAVCAGGSYTSGSVGGIPTVTPTSTGFDGSAIALTAAQIPGHTHQYTDYYAYQTQTAQPAYAGNDVQFFNALVNNANSTTGIDGVPNTACSAHTHSGNSLVWAGYEDQNGIIYYTSGGYTPPLPLIPNSVCYAWMMKQ